MSLLSRLGARAFGHRQAFKAPSKSLSGTVVGVALLLGGAAMANHLLGRRAERRHPPQGRFLEVEGVRLHYVDQGSGPVIVLIHGNGAMAEDFAVSGLLGMLAENHRVIAFDRPGFGYSNRPRNTIWTAKAQARLLQSALRELNVRAPTLVGHSWGSLVALNMALDDPAETAAIVLLSGYYVPTPRVDVAMFSVSALPVLGDILRYTVSPLIGRMMAGPAFRKIFAPAPVSRQFKALFPTSLSLRPSQLRATAADTALMIPGAMATVGRHPEVSVPVFIVAGDGDEIVDTATQSVRLHHDIADSSITLVKGAGHMVHHIAPQEVLRVIKAAAALGAGAD
jgi:pimeloyl-ACP methyl ester carboxylesterase